jgi:RNA polymerase sigma-70 factor (ECF subfamily)
MLRENDPLAAERLIEVFGDRVYGLSLRILTNEQDAQEAVQETFLTIWLKWDTFKGNSKFSSWIYRIAANHAFMKLRKRKKHNGNISLDHIDENGTPTAELIGSDSVDSDFMFRENTPIAAVEMKELGGIIEKAIDSLSPTYRTAYMLKDIDGLSLKEISDIMGLSEAAVKSRVHRARLELRRKISPYLG